MSVAPARRPLVAAPPKRNVPWFSRKNSRFSGKNRLKRVRLICCSSASTCAKSGLAVKSAVSPWVTPYLMSTPPSQPISFASGGDATGLVVRSPMPYGLTSNSRDAGGASIPTRVAASDARKWPRSPCAADSGVRYDDSFFQRLTRRAWKPQICGPSPR